MNITEKTFKDWMKSHFDENQLSDICTYGCQGGFPCLTYYDDTCHLYNHFKEEIWEMLLDDADSLGQNVFEMIGHFGGAKDVGSVKQFENLMTWYAAERVARELIESDED